jgi:divalent metal cation (Fe/Co/Zn/Cd) transporter
MIHPLSNPKRPAATAGNYWLDPVVALGIAAIIAFHAVKLIRRACRSAG